MRYWVLGLSLIFGCDLNVQAPIGYPAQQDLGPDVGSVCEAQCATLERQGLAHCVAPGCEREVVLAAQRCMAQACVAPETCPEACAHHATQRVLACALAPHRPGECAWQGQVFAARCEAACGDQCDAVCEAEISALNTLCADTQRRCEWADVLPACTHHQCASVGACAPCDQWIHDRAIACALQGISCRAEAEALCPQALCGTDCLDACALVGRMEGPSAQAACLMACAPNPCSAGCARAAEPVFIQCRSQQRPGRCAMARDSYFITCVSRCSLQN